MYKFQFINQGSKLTDEDLADAEKQIGQKFPFELKSHYLASNGGEIESGRCVYINKESGVEYNVNTFLPIKYKRFADDYLLEECFNFFVHEKHFMPANFIPIAIDDGGYPFVIDLNTKTINICYLADLPNIEPPIRFIAPSLQEFVDGLITEEEAYG